MFNIKKKYAASQIPAIVQLNSGEKNEVPKSYLKLLGL